MSWHSTNLEPEVPIWHGSPGDPPAGWGGTVIDQHLPAPINRPSPATSGGPAKLHGHGMVVRFAPIKGETPSSALDRRIWLPVVLGTLTLDETTLHTDYDTLSDGQFSIGQMGGVKARRLRTGQHDTMTVEFDPPWFVATGQDPEWLETRIAEVLRSHKAVQMTVSFNPDRGSAPIYDEPVTFRDLSKEYRAGEPDTRYVSLHFEEWRDASVGRRSSTPGRATSRKKPAWGSIAWGSHPDLPATVKLKAKDTLASLSYEYFGRYDYWRYFRDANGIAHKFGQNTPVVTLQGFHVGSSIKIPTVPSPNPDQHG